VMTVSNEIPSVAGAHPTAVDRRKLKKVPLQHLSWTQVLTRAVMQKDHQGVSDPDQAWILGELIRYLEHPRSGAMEFESMGGSWVAVRDAVQARTLRANDKGAAEVAGRWDQLISYAGLRLGRQLGVDVHPTLSRKELADPTVRATALLDRLASEGVLDGGLRIPNAVGPIGIVADLRASTVTVFVDVDAPREGRPTTRVNWLVRQLKDAPDSLRVDCYALHARTSTSELLKTVRENPAILVADAKREIRSFRIAQSAPMGSKSGQGRGSFIGSVLDLVDDFYRSTMQNLKPWAAAPPKLRPELADEQPDVPGALVSTSLSSQDGAEVATGPSNAVPAAEAIGQEVGHSDAFDRAEDEPAEELVENDASRSEASPEDSGDHAVTAGGSAVPPDGDQGPESPGQTWYAPRGSNPEPAD
jgi:hypothetical protein